LIGSLQVGGPKGKKAGEVLYIHTTGSKVLAGVTTGKKARLSLIIL
jgi:hypothetical protein